MLEAGPPQHGAVRQGDGVAVEVDAAAVGQAGEGAAARQLHVQGGDAANCPAVGGEGGMTMGRS